MWKRELRGRISAVNLKAVMSMQKRGAKNALQNFIAAAGVRQILIILQAGSTTFMRRDVNCRENAWNVRL